MIIERLKLVESRVGCGALRKGISPRCATCNLPVRRWLLLGYRGKGYRVAEAPATTSKTGPKPTGSCLTTNERAAAARSLLDMLQPRTAEIVKTIALQSGETAEACITRLIAYGAEVHHDLVNDGENPIGLVAPRDAKAATRH